MAGNMPTIWELAPHTAAKHQILKRYLDGWYPKLGLGATTGRVIFLDGFAGPGVYEGGAPGSPVIAVRSLLDHQSRAAITSKTEVIFVFNEHDPSRVAVLKRELDQLHAQHGGWGPNLQVHTFNSNFDELVDDILAHVGDGTLAPTFAFVDPFGYKDVSMEKLSRLLAAPRCELFIYFDFNLDYSRGWVWRASR